MKKVLIILLLLLPFNVLALELPNVNSSVVLVYDLTEDKELFNKGGSDKREIASLTKMITIYTALEYEKDLNKEITITDQMRWAVNPELSIHKIQTGEKYTVDEAAESAGVTVDGDTLIIPAGAALDITVTPHFTLVVYTITINKSDMGSATSTASGYEISDAAKEVTLTATPQDTSLYDLFD